MWKNGESCVWPLLFFFLLGNGDSSEPAYINATLRSMVKIQVNSTQRLEIDEAELIEKNYSYGSGFYISEDGLILTSTHVINKASRLQDTPIQCVELDSGKTYGLIVIFRDDDSDISLLQNVRYTDFNTKRKDFIHLNASMNVLRDGVECFCLGVPNELHKYFGIYAISAGKVLRIAIDLAGADKVKSRKKALLTSCEVAAGFSGGLVVDLAFNPLGIILGAVDSKQKKESYARKISDVLSVLKSHHVDIN